MAAQIHPSCASVSCFYRSFWMNGVVRSRFAMYALNGYPLRSQIRGIASRSSDSMPKIVKKIEAAYIGFAPT